VSSRFAEYRRTPAAAIQLTLYAMEKETLREMRKSRLSGTVLYPLYSPHRMEEAPPHG